MQTLRREFKCKEFHWEVKKTEREVGKGGRERKAVTLSSQLQPWAAPGASGKHAPHCYPIQGMTELDWSPSDSTQSQVEGCSQSH